MQFKFIASCTLALLLFSTSSFAKNYLPNIVGNAFRDGKPTVDFRLRYENALQEPLETAKATTLRSKVGFETAELWHSIVYLEMVDVASFFGQRYNPGVPELAKPEYSTINDPRGAGLTAAQLNFTGLDCTYIKLGRQYINLDNQRFIGTNDFRQYPQTFDAAMISNTFFDNLNLFYAYLGVQNTNFSNGRTPNSRHNLSSNIFHVDWNGYQYGNVVGYVYMNKDNTINTNSNSTVGVRIISSEYKNPEFNYALEVARQRGKLGNPNDYHAYYMLVELGKTIDIVTASIGCEVRSGSSRGDNRMFITPLGSNDNFNGLAEVFTTTPSRGLQDNYASLVVAQGGITLSVGYHYFMLNKGPGARSAGQELDIYGSIKLNQTFFISAAFAKYNTQNDVAQNTRRIWVMLEANFL